jgi:sugar phosphate isomerase/epimerase
VKLAISNIAWETSEQEQVFEAMKRLGVSGLEIAPTKIWPDLLSVERGQVEAFLDRLAGWEIQVVAAQALLFGKPELTIFGSEEVRGQTLDYLERVIALVSGMGAKVTVFGSPKNRQRGEMTMELALEIAEQFFRAAGEIAVRYQACLCIEANPVEYGCDFVNTLPEALELVQRVDHPGFGLHIDASAITLNGEDPQIVLPACQGWVRHFHISEPYLGLAGSGETGHRLLAAMLESIGYTGWASIEMRSGLAASNLEAVRRALEFAREIYG